jgi:hypothetical protein
MAIYLIAFSGPITTRPLKISALLIMEIHYQQKHCQIDLQNFMFIHLTME